MIWLSARAIEGADDPHAAAAAGAGWRLVVDARFIIGIVAMAIGQGGHHRQELAAQGNFVGAVAVGEQPIMTNAVESVRQHVEQKTTDELAGRKPHDLVFAVAVRAVVLPPKADMPIVAV